MRQIILADRYSVNDIVKEECNNWVKFFLLSSGIPEHEIYEDNQEILLKHGIEIWNEANKDVEIKKNNILIGKWYNPILIPKYDEKNIIYYEVHLDYDSIFENELYVSEHNG